MTLSDLGSLGEVVSGIAVLITLVYLAYQTRQNTKIHEQTVQALTAQMLSQNTDTGMQLQRDLMKDPKLAEIVERLQVGGNFDEPERRVAEAYLSALFLKLENLGAQSRLAGFDIKSVENIICRQVTIYADIPVFVAWWKRVSDGNYSLPFVRSVNKILAAKNT